MQVRAPIARELLQEEVNCNAKWFTLADGGCPDEPETMLTDIRDSVQVWAL